MLTHVPFVHNNKVFYYIRVRFSLREKLESKGYTIVDEFNCAGFNIISFIKLIGGLHKGRPNAEDLEHTEEFAMRLKQNLEKM